MFRRGFKTWCERIALNVRGDCAVAPIDPLSAFDVAAQMKIRVLSIGELPDLPAETTKRLLAVHRKAWSAVSLSDGVRTLIVHNSAHSAGRQSSDLMHELAHQILRHEPGRSFMNPEKGLFIRSYDPAQEEEANWLAGCLLLPRGALLAALKRGLSPEKICEQYSVTSEMFRFRVNTTGVDRQLQARSRAALRQAGGS